VPAIVRRAYFPLKKFAMNPDRQSPLYLHGPRGVGKSYLLYMLAAELAIDQRKHNSKIRVTYINDCSSWIGNDNYMLTELIMTFASVEKLDVASKCQGIMATFDEPARQNRILALIDEVCNFVNKSNLRWFIVFDQLNGFHDLRSPSAPRAAFNWRIVTNLASTRSRNVTVLGSASANNERFPVEFDGWEKYSVDFVPKCYDETEFNLWCERSGLVPTDDSTREILYYTGGVPLELDIYTSIKVDSFSEQLKKYKSTRLEALAVSHKKFCSSLTTEQEIMNLKVCIGRMALYLSPPEIQISMDRQLLVIEENKVTKKERIVALFPLARSAIMSFHSSIIQDSLKMVAEVVFEDRIRYPNDVKGRVVERYIITSLEQKKRFNFQSRKFGTKTSVSFHGVIEDVIYFDGNLLPIRRTIQESLCSLIVPTSSEYPGIDFFIWNPEGLKNVLLAVQVTIKKSLRAHMRKCKFKCADWCQFLGIRHTSVRTLWMAPNECIGVDKELSNGLDNYILAFDDLVDLCPIIKSLNRGPVGKAPAAGGDLDSSTDSEDEDAMDQVQNFVFAPRAYLDR
jgi:hypothetical protein